MLDVFSFVFVVGVLDVDKIESSVLLLLLTLLLLFCINTSFLK